NWDDPSSGRLNPALFPVNPFPTRPTKVCLHSVATLVPRSRLQIVRELQEFYEDNTNLFPQLSYVHHLYVYPEVLFLLAPHSEMRNPTEYSLSCSRSITVATAEAPSIATCA